MLTSHATKYSTPETPTQPAGAGYNVSLGYLRAFITLLVVAHHSVLAYISFAPPAPRSLTAEPRYWQAFPVVDTHHWQGFDLLVGFNDIFFMSLMFFLSGLFVWPSLERKGVGRFVRDRLVRLGLPFIVAAGIIAPLAYFPAYLMTGASANVPEFLKTFWALGQWPSGPAWFVWLLLAFDCVAAALVFAKHNWGTALGRSLEGISKKPAALFAVVVLATAVVYIPMSVAFGPLRWSTGGPFVFQTSRLFLYAFYFVLGIAVGALGIDRGLLATGGKLARRWPLWVIAALLAFVVSVAVTLMAISAKSPLPIWAVIGGFGFVLSCAASSFACLAVFERFARRPNPLFSSLSANAYGIYLVHYAFVSWLQYALLPAALSGFAKGVLVTLGAVLLSWGSVAALRRIPGVARVV